MDLEQAKAIYGAKQVGNALADLIGFLLTRWGILLFILLQVYLWYNNQPHIKEARKLELTQSKIENDAKYCFKKKVRRAVRTETPLAKDAMDVCMQEAIAREEQFKANRKKEIEFMKEQYRKEAEVIAESKR